MKKTLMTLWLTALLYPGIDAQKSYLNQADSLNTSIPVEGYFAALEAVNNILLSVEGDTIYSYDLEAESILQKYVLPDPDYTGYPSFLTIDPNGVDFWVGYTTGDNSDDRIYRFDVRTEEWLLKATMPGNFDLAFWEGQPLVSGLNSTDWNTPNGIWALDMSGADSHRLVVSTGGYSAGLDVDAGGNLYYGTSLFSGNAILRWDNALISDALLNSEDPLDITDAEILSTLPSSVYDVALDNNDNLVFNCNNFVLNFIGRWTGEAGEGAQYDTLATTELYLTRLTTRGDIRSKEKNNQVFALAYGAEIAELHYDLPPYLDNPFTGITLHLDDTEPTHLNLNHLFADEDDHDSLFIYEIIENSNPFLLESTLEDSLLILKILGTVSGKADIIVSAYTGLLSASDTLQVTVAYPVGTGPARPEEAIVIYPNPATDYLHIGTPGDGMVDELVMLDMNGRTIRRMNHIPSHTTIDLSDLRTGYYLLQISCNGKLYRQSFLKN